MSDIRHRVGVTAPQEQVHHALGTLDGLAGWWTRNVSGDPEPGGKLSFNFDSPGATAKRGVVMEVTADSPDQVGWRCVKGPDEWLDTTITFDLAQSGDETVVLFTHGGWREPVEFMSHCSTKWAFFLLGMKDGLEGGRAKPYPDDGDISSWG